MFFGLSHMQHSTGDCSCQTHSHLQEIPHFVYAMGATWEAHDGDGTLCKNVLQYNTDIVLFCLQHISPSTIGAQDPITSVRIIYFFCSNPRPFLKWFPGTKNLMKFGTHISICDAYCCGPGSATICLVPGIQFHADAKFGMYCSLKKNKFVMYIALALLHRDISEIFWILCFLTYYVCQI